MRPGERLLKLVLLAAGRSSRFGSPKQTAPLGPTGGSLMAYTIVDALRAGFGDIIVVTTGELEPLIQAHLDEVLGPGLPVRWCHQRIVDLPAEFSDRAGGREKPWGTGQAVLAARDLLGDEPFAVANADDWYGPEAWVAAEQAVTTFLRKPDPDRAVVAQGFNVAYPVSATLSETGGVSRGWIQLAGGNEIARVLELYDVRAEEDEIRGRDETGGEHEISRDTLVSMNLWGLGAGVLRLLQEGFRQFLESSGQDPTAEYPLSSALDTELQSARLRLRLVGGGRRWFGVTHPGDKEDVRGQLEALHAEGVYSTPLRSMLLV